MIRKMMTVLLLSSGLALAGCATKPKELPPQPMGPMPGSQADFIASVLGDTILFDTDRYNVDTEGQGILQSQAQWLARYPARRITIEGHCDERGTRDYNIALGERRANAVSYTHLTLPTIYSV